MYRTKTFYSSDRTNFNNFPIVLKNDQKIYNSYNKILETIINKDQVNFNKEIIEYSKYKNININDPLYKIFNIIKNNFENIELNSSNDTDLKLEYLQYLISFDINETNGEFLEEKLEIARIILQNNNNKLKY
jgi:hypothetical protein